MSRYRRKFDLLPVYDKPGEAGLFERMAAKGWELCGGGRWSWKFRRAEPAEARYAVAYYARGSEYAPPDSDELAFRELCARTGWEFVCSRGYMQVFVNRSVDPLPLDTDPELEFELTDRMARKAALFSAAALAAALFLLWFTLSRALDDPLAALVSMDALILPLLLSGVALCCLGDLLCWALWRRRARAAAERGEFYASRRIARVNAAIPLLLPILLALCVLGRLFYGGSGRESMRVVINAAAVLTAGAAGAAVSSRLRAAEASRGRNIALSALAVFVSCAAVAVLGALLTWREADSSAAPLTISDLGGGDYAYAVYIETDASPFAELYSYEERYVPFGDACPKPAPGEDISARLRYSVYRARIPSVYPELREGVLWAHQGLTEPCDAAPFGAKEARYIEESFFGVEQAWILCYGESVVYLEYNRDLSAENCAAIAAAFGGESA